MPGGCEPFAAPTARGNPMPLAYQPRKSRGDSKTTACTRAAVAADIAVSASKSGAQPTFGHDWKITLGNASSPSVGVHSGLPEDVRVAFCETSRHASGLAGVSGWTQAVRRTSPAWGVSQGTVLASG